MKSEERREEIIEEIEERLEERKERRECFVEAIREDEQQIRESMKENEESIRHALRNMYSITEDVAPNEEIKDRILSGGKVTGTNMVVMICAILIASVGLNTNSVAVIIGAMLISPLMGSILAIAYGTASNNSFLMRKHLVGFLVQIGISVLTATIYFALSPMKGVTEQLMARTQPRFYDVIIAIAGGVAGIVGQTRRDKANNIIPGVAIATALMPPLCTCGYAIATGSLRMLGGAFYLFLINAYFIYASADAVLAFLGTPREKEMTEEQWKNKKRKMIRNTVLVMIPVIILGIYDLFFVL